jgi:hypothetical protein
MPRLTNPRAIRRFGVIDSPIRKAPLINTPKTGVKNRKACMMLTG